MFCGVVAVVTRDDDDGSNNRRFSTVEEIPKSYTCFSLSVLQLNDGGGDLINNHQLKADQVFVCG